ncbi:MAG: hypothetical protein WDW38_004085 [Sanguina aurantia]
MGAQLLSCCSEMHLLFEKITSTVLANPWMHAPSDRACVQHQKASLQAQISDAHTCLHPPQLKQALLWKSPLTATAKSLMRSHGQLEGSFAALVTALLNAQEGISRSPPTNKELPPHAIASLLFSLLFDACEAFSLWTLDWPSDSQHTHPQLLLALLQLATWQLREYRPSSAPTVSAPSCCRISTTPVESYILLAPALKVLTRISRQSAGDVADLLSKLPPSLFTTVCCVASEQLRTGGVSAQPSSSAASAASAVAAAAAAAARRTRGARATTTAGATAAAAAVAQAAAEAAAIKAWSAKRKLLTPTVLHFDDKKRQGVFKSLVQLVYAGSLADQRVGRDDCCLTFLAPAVVEAYKLGLIAIMMDSELKPEPRCAVPDMHVQDATHVLTSLLRAVRMDKIKRAALTIFGLGHPSTYGIDPTPETSLELAPRVATPDRQLVAVVCRRQPDSIDIMHYNARLMIAILEGWPVHSDSEPPVEMEMSQREQSDAAYCLARVARQGSGFAWCCLQSVKQRLALVPQPGRGVTVPSWSKENQLVMVDIRELMVLVYTHAAGRTVQGSGTLFTAHPSTHITSLTLSPTHHSCENCTCLSLHPRMDASDASNVGRRTGNARHPDLLRLNRWSRLHCTAAVLEACLRDTHRPPTAHQACLAAVVATRALASLCRPPRFGRALDLCVSLASTVRKLMQPHTALSCPTNGPGGTTGGQRQQRQQQPPLVGEWFAGKEVVRAKEPLEEEQASELMVASMVAIATIHRAMQALRVALQAAHGDPTGAALVSFTPGAPVTRPRSSQASVAAADELRLHISQLHQVTAILFQGLVVLGQWRVGSGSVVDQGLSGTVEWIASNCGGVGEGLLAVATSALRAPLPLCRNTRALQGLKWELYAQTCFHGRLVAGCCNLACSDMGGASEAGLKTRLCGGCRRARYCSAGCQAEAWSERGHSLLCCMSTY